MAIKVNSVESAEVDVTAEYCFEKAAECLIGQGQYTQGPGVCEVAREWRLLGESISTQQLTALATLTNIVNG